MLSAIAARKAAQAAQLASVDGSTTPHAPQAQSPSPSTSGSPPPQKRKAQESESLQKKRQKNTRLKNAQFRHSRYFEIPRPIQGFDDESEVVDEPDTLDELKVNESAPTSRPYSPSRPVSDNNRSVANSSEDEDHSQRDNTGPGEAGIIRFPSEPQMRRTTFIPRPDSNVFRLTGADLALLQLPSYTFASGNAALLLLAPGESLSFVGTACVTLLQGAITILGTPVTPSLHAHRIFSPRSSPLVSLDGLDTRSSDAESSASSRYALRNGGMFPLKVQSAVNVSDNVVIIQQMTTAVETLGKVCRTFDGVFGVDAELGEVEMASIGVEGCNLVNLDMHPRAQLQPFYLPDSWTKALDAAIPSLPLGGGSTASPTTSFIGLVRGPKKCGKSTFARTLLNNLTTRYRHVAFLECDLGQSEFTPGGMVSLHVVSRPVFGPPFTHPQLPYRAHYVGHTTPRSYPAYYVSCIQALVQTYRMDVQYAYGETSTTDFSANNEETVGDDRIGGFVPLIVNTQGWVKGLGGDLLRKIEEIVGATHIFDLDMQTVVLPRQRMQPSAASIHPLEPIQTSPLTAYYTSADHRSLAILSYFYCVFPPQHMGLESVRWVTDIPLCARLPWQVDCGEALDRIILVGPGYEDVVPQDLTHAINCGVVALVCDEEHSTLIDDQESRADSPFPYKQGAPAPDPNTTQCMGLALVRGVDAATRALHVLTPLSYAGIARCRVLVKGELELPVWGMLDFREGQDGVAGVPWEKVPYLQMGGRSGVVAVGAGAGRKRVRRNLMRRGQM